jgi:Ca2+-binding RTX toxin-like protein
MKRSHLLVVVLVVVGALAFGADAAFASIDFNPQTGEMSYSTEGINVDKGDVVLVRHAESAGFTDWTKIDYAGFQFGQVQPTANMAKYCFHEDYVLWACPAKKVAIHTGNGGDQITVNYDVKIPTVLEGGKGSDIIYGGGGPDEIWGACRTNPSCDSSPDSLHGGDGNDVLHGGSANYDYLAGDAGDDHLDGGFGTHDNLYGGDGRDIADYSSRTAPIVASLDGTANDGAGENDYIASDVEGIQGGSGQDTLYAGFLTDSILKGGPGADTLYGYAGNDLLMGEAGNDTLRPGNGHDNVYGGSDQDTVSYSERLNPVTVTLDGVANDGETGENDYVASDVETVIGGKSNDTLSGNAQANTLIGGPGNDTLDGKGGQPDHLLGEAGNDTLDGGPAGSSYDVLDGGADIDKVSYASRTDGVFVLLNGSTGGEDKIVNVENAKGGDGDDHIVGTDGPNALFGGAGYDALQGNAGDDHLYGGGGNDKMYGNAGADVLAGSIGNDTLYGGPGADWMTGGDGIDQVSYEDYTVPVTVKLDGIAKDGAAGEGDDVLSDIEMLIGGKAGDTLVGDDNPNWIYGGPGNDKLFGMGGNDMLDGQANADTTDGGASTDICFGETKVNCEK